jgi:hypothetical protein
MQRDLRDSNLGVNVLQRHSSSSKGKSVRQRRNQGNRSGLLSPNRHKAAERVEARSHKSLARIYRISQD